MCPILREKYWCRSETVHCVSLPLVTESLFPLICLDSVDDEGNSPMHHAASEGNVKCVKELIRTGASVLILNKLGQKPINLAQLKGHRVTAK